jgi:serine/threonine protein kinase
MVGDKVDPRSDVYSVGALLHYMLTAHPVKRGGPRPPADLAPIIDKATRDDRRDRYPRAAVMRGELEATGAPLSVMPPPLDSASPPVLAPRLRPVVEDESSGLDDVLPLDFSEPIQKKATPAPSSSRRIALVASAIGLVAAIGVGAYALVGDAGAAPLREGSDEAERPQRVAAGGPERQRSEDGAGSAAPAAATDSETEPASASETALSTRTDLLSGELPPPLDVFWPRVAGGEELPLRERHLIERYASANREDARPHILLARDFMARGWSSDAISRYREAFATDPESRADARMLMDLLELSQRSSSGPPAAQAIARIYGRDALLDVQALLDGELEGGARRRLEQLKTRLSRL